MKRVGLTVATAAAVLWVRAAAHATEAAMGRYVTGVFTTPLAGIVPPAPGFYWSSANMYYSASAGADLHIPIGNQVSFGLDATIVGTTFTGLWVPSVEIAPDTTLALSISIPVQYMEATASLGAIESKDHDTALGDIMFAPTLGWHSGKNFLSASLRIFAPTGPYEAGRIANIGMNYWTFSPTLSYTYFDMSRGLDFSMVGGIDINTRNPDTDYTSGAMAHLDASLMQYLSKELAIGVFGSVLYQFENDKGPLADQLDGFKGRSFAIGPILKYNAGTDTKPVNISLSWAPEFGTKNRLKGNAVYFSVSGAF
ncbi:transporter [Mesorhizobium sp. M1066]|uniref:SphA family protein n=1 Tax=unclassified Mesorhizobium TaxID=325217 RepID=UPI00333893C6